MTKSGTALPEWGTRLASAHEWEDVAIPSLVSGFSATLGLENSQADDPLTALRVRQARNQANFLPPEGQVFVNLITGDRVAVLSTTCANQQGRIEVVRQPIPLDDFKGQFLVGSRVNFPWRLPKPDHPTSAQLYVVDEYGKTPAHSLHVPLGITALYYTGCIEQEALAHLETVDPAALITRGIEMLRASEAVQ